MTNHAKLSRELALTLGYYPENVRIVYSGTDYERCEVYRLPPSKHIDWPVWLKFDYRDPTVCLPLIEWLMRKHDAQPGYNARGFHIWFQSHSVAAASADTLPEAVARAVIAVKKG